MAFTSDDLIAIEKAIATGAKEVTYGDKKLVNQDLKDLLLIRDTIKKELGLSKPNSGRKLASFNKGLGGPQNSDVDFYSSSF